MTTFVLLEIVSLVEDQRLSALKWGQAISPNSACSLSDYEQALEEQLQSQIHLLKSLYPDIGSLKHPAIRLSLLWIWVSGLALVSDDIGAPNEALPFNGAFIAHHHHFVFHLLPPQAEEAYEEKSSES